MKKYILAFLIILITIGINIPGGFLGRLGFDANILTVVLIAMVCAGLMQFHNLGLIVLIAIVAVAANVPAETAAAIGYDPDWMLAALVALVILPVIARQL